MHEQDRPWSSARVFIWTKYSKHQVIFLTDINDLLKQLAHDDFQCGIVLYRGQEVVPFGEKLWAVPVEFLWH